MTSPYPIVDVSEWPRDPREQMGTKTKFWCLFGETAWLFKEPRRTGGEHWSEMVAAEIAAILQVPHAEVRLATHSGKYGSLSRDFTDRGCRGDLVHGNELMQVVDPDYPATGPNFSVSEHTISRIFHVLQAFEAPIAADLPKGAQGARGAFCGYLLLDALVGNTDRHHENWAVILGPDGQNLAPSYDHASCLGRELTDTDRQNRCRILRRDQTVVGYLESRKGRSRIYDDGSPPKPLRPLEVFHRAHGYEPAAWDAWLTRLDSTPFDQIAEAVHRLPSAIASEPAREFALRVLQLNQAALTSRSFRYE